MTKRKPLWALIPLAGSSLFILLYLIATAYYPGGSQQDAHAAGWSWQHNYWCNLLNKNGINGQPNSAQYVAFTAMLILCFTLFAFWWIAAVVLPLSGLIRKLLKGAGFLAMVVLPFLTTLDHDTVMNVAGFFGIIAMIICYYGIFRLRWYRIFLFGIFNILLIGINNYMYYGNGMLYYLPVVQKISFLCFLLWISIVTIQFYHRACKQNQSGEYIL